MELTLEVVSVFYFEYKITWIINNIMYCIKIIKVVDNI